jgi:hypothetical protein
MPQTHRRYFSLILCTIFGIGLAACTAGKHPAAASVEAFLQALVEKDEARYVTLTCGDYEADALLEYDAFSLVQARLEGLDCQAESVAGDAANVSCQGQIVATYGNEDQTFDLGERQYRVINQGGEWLVCGY